jgi:uncharacterized protein (DUF362 family)
MKDKVRAVHCPHDSTDDAVYAALRRAAEPLEKSWDKLKKANRIAIKFNQDFPPWRIVKFKDQRQQLVSDKVARAVLRLLREETTAEIVCCDVSYYAMYNDGDVEETTTIAGILREFGVKYINGVVSPRTICRLDKGEGMFPEYTMLKDLVDADSVVSVAKMKNHIYMGVTGCLKNLFGLLPGVPPERTRHYFHHIIRLPHVLADLGILLKPDLNIVDGLVGQAGAEWEPGVGRVVNTLIAGDNAVSTDACMAHLMGHDPTADWPVPPFLMERNCILIAAERGLGTVNLSEIDFETEVERQSEGIFFNGRKDTAETIRQWRLTMCEQALHYRDNLGSFEEFESEYILLQNKRVVWHDVEGLIKMSRRKLAGKHRDDSLFLKFVDLKEEERENYSIYEQTLEAMK